MNYYIQGNAAKADQIKAAFEAKGYSDKGFTFDVDDILFFTANNEHINVCPANGWLANIIKTHPDYQELQLLVEPNFKVGDWVVKKDGETFYGGNYVEQITLIEVDEEGKRIWLTSKTWVDDDDIRLWTIQDAKDGDVLTTDNGWTCIFQAFDGYLFSSYCFMDSQKWFCEVGSEAHTLDSRINGNIHPATKEQRDLLFTKMKEAGYQWDEKKKELRNIIKPKFKAGDKVLNDMMIVTVREVVYDQNYKEYKYDIGNYWVLESVLKPYKSHYNISNFHAGMPVLVRDFYKHNEWTYAIFSHYNKNHHETCRFMASGTGYWQCIPFNEDTKHLLGTIDMCDEQYINW